MSKYLFLFICLCFLHSCSAQYVERTSPSFFYDAITIDSSTFRAVDNLIVDEDFCEKLDTFSSIFVDKIEVSKWISEYDLDSWGVIQLIEEYLTLRYAGYNSNILTLASFFLLRDLHYKSSLFVDVENNYYVGVESRQLTDDCIIVGNENFHFLFKAKYEIGHRICETQGAKELSFSTLKLPKISLDSIEIVRTVYHGNTKYQFNLQIDTFALIYSLKIPYIHWGDSITYCEKSDLLKNSISTTIGETIKTWNLNDKLSFILSFCQQQKHVDDRSTFGREIFLSPEYTLFSTSADCDDKSILFSSLLWDLLRLKTIIITYPNDQHMNVGVLGKYGDQSRYVEYKDEIYTICEPSGLWYPIGKQMEGVATSDYKILEVNHPN